MCAVLYRTGEPYVVGKRIVFTSWYYVRPGSSGWKDVSGKKVSYLNTLYESGDLNMRREAHSRGVRIAARKPVRSGPLFPVERPWEERGIGISTILKDGDVYKAWGGNGWGDLTRNQQTYTCYFESKDGLSWIRPDCGLIEYGGNKRNNLILDSVQDGFISGGLGTVFIDRSAPAAERYKAILCDEFTAEQYENYRRLRPEALDPKAVRKDSSLILGASGAVSPDGIHWTRIKEPLVLTHTDTQIVAYYDLFLKKYVAYFRDWMVGPMAENAPDPKGVRWVAIARRAISRAETEDFRRFPLPELIVEPGPELGPCDVFYTNCYTTIPGAPEQHLLFPAIWNSNDDTTRIKMMTSCDGKVWHDVPDGMILDTADFGQWDGGCVFAIPNLIERPNGDFALPYGGYSVPHKYPRMKATRNYGYAVWPKGRICGLEAADLGQFETVAIMPPGSKLLINAVAKRAGSILVEAATLGEKSDIIPGREFENAIPLFGDLFKVPVVWKGQDTHGIPPNDPNKPVILRFKLDRATIYGLEFV